MRTIFTTADSFCAHLAGFDYPCEPGTDGGFSVAFDAGAPAVVSLMLTDGEIVGLPAIRQLADALLSAERMAKAPHGVPQCGK